MDASLRPSLDRQSSASRVQRVVSPGGIEAWLVEERAVPLVAVHFAFLEGSTRDPDGKGGLASLFSSLLDEGAGPYDSAAFQDRLDDLAVELSFSASHDALSGTLRTLLRNRAEAFDMLRLALTEAHFSPDALGRSKAQISAGLRNELKEPQYIAAKAYRARALSGHPYAQPVNGTLESVSAITHGDILAMRPKLLARSNLKVAVVGAIDAATLATLLDEVFGGLPAQAAPVDLPPLAFHDVGGREVIDLDVPQSTIRFGRPGLSRTDPDFLPALVGNHILGGGSFTSRLWQEVREKRGLAYSVGSGLSPSRHGGGFDGSTATSNERAAESIRIIGDEIARFAEDGPTEDELEKARRFLIGSYGLRFDTSSKIAGELVAMQFFGLPIDYGQRHTGLLASVTRESATAAARRLLGDGKLLMVAVGRPEGVETHFG